MGISLGDFMKLTPEELEAAFEARNETYKYQDRGSWERARMLATAMVAPHLGKGKSANPKKLFPMPWDAEAKAQKPQVLSREESEKRYQKLMDKLNGKQQQEQGHNP